MMSGKKDAEAIYWQAADGVSQRWYPPEHELHTRIIPVIISGVRRMRISYRKDKPTPKSDGRDQD